MKINYKEIGICGLSCRFCSRYHTEGISRCGGCKSSYMLAVGCPFITCAVKRKGIEFCWDCEEKRTCKKWKKQRTFSKHHDTFICYQKVEDNIAFIEQNGIVVFEKEQKIKERLLKQMLKAFNEGRSKSYYCVATTVMKIDELKKALSKARTESTRLGIKEKAKLLHSILDEIANQKRYYLKLRT